MKRLLFFCIFGIPSLAGASYVPVALSTTGPNASTCTVVINGTPNVSITNTPTVTANPGGPFSVVFNTAPVVTDTQSGTWTMQPGNTANTTPWMVVASSNANTQIITSSGAAIVEQDESTIQLGTATFFVQTATWTSAASGYATIVSTVTGRRITVIGWDANASGTAVNIQFQSGGGTFISGTYFFAANGGAVHDCSHWCFQSKPGEALGVNLSAAQTASGTIQYIAGP